MSVTLKNTTMPNCCNECDFLGNIDDKGNACPCYCFMDNTLILTDGKKRHEDCPLESVDELIEQLQEYRKEMAKVDHYDLVGDCIDIVKEYCEGD